MRAERGDVSDETSASETSVETSDSSGESSEVSSRSANTEELLISLRETAVLITEQRPGIDRGVVVALVEKAEAYELTDDPSYGVLKEYVEKSSVSGSDISGSYSVSETNSFVSDVSYTETLETENDGYNTVEMLRVIEQTVESLQRDLGSVACGEIQRVLERAAVVGLVTSEEYKELERLLAEKKKRDLCEEMREMARLVTQKLPEVDSAEVHRLIGKAETCQLTADPSFSVLSEYARENPLHSEDSETQSESSPSASASVSESSGSLSGTETSSFSSDTPPNEEAKNDELSDISNRSGFSDGTKNGMMAILSELIESLRADFDSVPYSEIISALDNAAVIALERSDEYRELERLLAEKRKHDLRKEMEALAECIRRNSAVDIGEVTALIAKAEALGLAGDPSYRVLNGYVHEHEKEAEAISELRAMNAKLANDLRSVPLQEIMDTLRYASGMGLKDSPEYACLEGYCVKSRVLAGLRETETSLSQELDTVSTETIEEQLEEARREGLGDSSEAMAVLRLLEEKKKLGLQKEMQEMNGALRDDIHNVSLEDIAALLRKAREAGLEDKEEYRELAGFRDKIKRMSALSDKLLETKYRIQRNPSQVEIVQVERLLLEARDNHLENDANFIDLSEVFEHFADEQKMENVDETLEIIQNTAVISDDTSAREEMEMEVLHRTRKDTGIRLKKAAKCVIRMQKMNGELTDSIRSVPIKDIEGLLLHAESLGLEQTDEYKRLNALAEIVRKISSEFGYSDTDSNFQEIPRDLFNTTADSALAVFRKETSPGLHRRIPESLSEEDSEVTGTTIPENSEDTFVYIQFRDKSSQHTVYTDLRLFPLSEICGDPAPTLNAVQTLDRILTRAENSAVTLQAAIRTHLCLTTEKTDSEVTAESVSYAEDYDLLQQDSFYKNGDETSEILKDRYLKSGGRVNPPALDKKRRYCIGRLCINRYSRIQKPVPLNKTDTWTRVMSLEKETIQHYDTL